MIVAAAGRPYSSFIDALTDLASRIRSSAPRPCSFASATTTPITYIVGTAETAYRRLVSGVDESLFRHKAAARNVSSTLNGVVVDIGTLELDGRIDKRRHQPARQQSLSRLSAEGDNHAS